MGDAANERVDGVDVPVVRSAVIRSWLAQARELGYLAELFPVTMNEEGRFQDPRLELKIEENVVSEVIELNAAFELVMFETNTYVIEPKSRQVPFMTLTRDDQVHTFFRILREAMMKFAPTQLKFGAYAVFYYAHNWNQRFTFEQIVRLLPLLVGVESFFRVVTEKEGALSFEELTHKYGVAFEMFEVGAPVSLIIDLYPELRPLDLFGLR